MPPAPDDRDRDVTVLVQLRLYGGGTGEEAAEALAGYHGSFDLPGGREAEIIAVTTGAPQAWAPALHALPALGGGELYDVARPADWATTPGGVQVIAEDQAVAQVNAMTAAAGELLLVRRAWVRRHG